MQMSNIWWMFQDMSILVTWGRRQAANHSKVDIAEARMKGEVGSKIREGKTLQNAAKIDVETKIISMQRQGEGKKEELKVKTEVKVYENQREAEVADANAELVKKKAGWAKEAQVAEVMAAKAVALKNAELQKEVERTNTLTRTEKLKAGILSKASVESETKAQEANWSLYQKQRWKMQFFKKRRTRPRHRKQLQRNNIMLIKSC